MKSIISRCVCGFGVCLLIGVVLLAAGVSKSYAAEITIVDPFVREAVYDSLGIDPSNPLTDADMLGLTYLRLKGKGVRSVTSFSGLEYAANLSVIDLYGTDVQDSAGLSQLSMIDQLKIRYCDLDNFDSIYLMTQIDTFELTGYSLPSIVGIESLVNLDWLLFSNCQIGDLSPVNSLTNLAFLALPENGFSSADCQALSGMSNLSGIDLQSNQIDDISFLSSMLNLDTLILKNNFIEDISILADMHNLQGLYLEGNPLNDDAYDIYIPQIIANNPDIHIYYDPIPEPSTLAFLASGLFVLAKSKKRVWSWAFRSVGNGVRYVILGCMVFVVFTSPLYAVNYVWDGSFNNSWLYGSNWNPNYVPGLTDNLTIAGTTSTVLVEHAPLTVQTNGAYNATIGNYAQVTHSSQTLDFDYLNISGAMIGSNIGSFFTMNNSSTNTYVTQGLNLGNGVGKAGAFVHNDGFMDAAYIKLGLSSGFGHYEFNDGTVEYGHLYVGLSGTSTSAGIGNFVQAGGSLDKGFSSSTIYIGYGAHTEGYYTITGGEMWADNITVGHDDDGDAELIDSVLTIDGGLVSTPELVVNRTGLVQFTASETFWGDIEVNGGKIRGVDENTYLQNMELDYYIDGYTVMNMQDNSELVAAELVVGDGAYGIMHQYDDSEVQLACLVVGDGENAVASYTVNEDAIMSVYYGAAPNIYVGYAGQGDFVQNNGTVTTVGQSYYGSVLLGVESTSSGRYEFSGGDLEVYNIYVGYGGEGEFYWKTSPLLTSPAVPAKLYMIGDMTVGSSGTLAMGWDFDIQDLFEDSGSNYFYGYGIYPAGTLDMNGEATLKIDNGATGTSGIAYDPACNLYVADGMLNAFSSDWLDMSVNDGKELKVDEGLVQCENFTLGDATTAGTLKFTGGCDTSDNILGELKVYGDFVINSSGVVEAVVVPDYGSVNTDGDFIIRIGRESGDTTAGSFVNHVDSSSAVNVDFSDMTLICSYYNSDNTGSFGVETMNLEVCGDPSQLWSAFDAANEVENFVIDKLVVGRSLTDSGVAVSGDSCGIRVCLVNGCDNGIGSGDDAAGDCLEAMYVRTLEILPGGAISPVNADGDVDLFYLRIEGETADTFRQFFPGDLNLDGLVNLDDFITLKQNYGVSGKEWSEGDLNADRVVNLDDFILLKQFYGCTTPTQSRALSSIPAIGDFDNDGEITMNDFTILARRQGYRI